MGSPSKIGIGKADGDDECNQIITRTVFGSGAKSKGGSAKNSDEAVLAPALPVSSELLEIGYKYFDNPGFILSGPKKLLEHGELICSRLGHEINNSMPGGRLEQLARISDQVPAGTFIGADFVLCRINQFNQETLTALELGLDESRRSEFLSQQETSAGEILIEKQITAKEAEIERIRRLRELIQELARQANREGTESALADGELRLDAENLYSNRELQQHLSESFGRIYAAMISESLDVARIESAFPLLTALQRPAEYSAVLLESANPIDEEDLDAIASPEALARIYGDGLSVRIDADEARVRSAIDDLRSYADDVQRDQLGALVPVMSNKEIVAEMLDNDAEFNFTELDNTGQEILEEALLTKLEDGQINIWKVDEKLGRKTGLAEKLLSEGLSGVADFVEAEILPSYDPDSHQADWAKQQTDNRLGRSVLSRSAKRLSASKLIN